MEQNKKELTLGSLFDGSGGFPLAGKLAGIEPVWASEVEPFPIAVTQKRLPEMIHYGDINELNGAELPPVDIITGGFPCFPAGTLVLTDKGYIEIENVRVGMKVLTHMGRWRKVTATGSKEGETIVLKGNHYGLECTPNHPIYSAEMKRYYPQLGNGKRGCWRKVGKEKEWTAAEKMKDKLWAVPNTFDQVSIDPPHYSGDPHEKPMPAFSEDFFYLVGRWLGDGWVRDNQRTGRPEGQRWSQIVICAGYEKEDALKAAVEAVIDRYNVERCRTAVKYKFCGRVFCSWLTENFGKYAYGKRIPSWAYSMPEKWRAALLKGICDTDGYLAKSGHMKITTVSKKLAHGIRLLAETLGYSSTVYFDKRPATCVIEGRTVNQRDTYTVNLVHSETRMRLADELHTWYKVRNIENTGERKTVYNMTVEEDNSYIADDIVVHNCQDVSIAGKRAGLEGKRTGLFYEAVRIIKEMREKTNGQYPRFFIAENVPGIYSSNGGEDFRAVLEEIIKIAEPEAPPLPMPGKEGWPYADVYLGDGWSVAYRTLDAQYFGTAQRRRRMFLVADFRDRSAGEVLFKSESVLGYTPPCICTRQGAAGDFKTCAGKAGSAGRDGGRVVLNDQGGQRMDVTDDVTNTLRAEAHHPPVVMEGAAGFCTEHSAKSRSIGYEEEKSPTLRAGVVPAAVFENHSQDSRYTGPLDVAPTVSATYGMGGNNQPFVTEEAVPVTMKIRSGCAGGGKGQICQRDKSATLGCNNDQTLFVPEKSEQGQQAFGISSFQSHAMLSDNPHSGIYEAETSRTLDVGGGNPSCNQGGVCVVEKCFDIRPTSDGTKVSRHHCYETDTSRSLGTAAPDPTGNHGGVAVVEHEPTAFTQNQRDEVRNLGDKSGALQAQPGMKQQTYVLQGNMIGRDDKNGPQGCGVSEDVCYTLTDVDRHAVAAADPVYAMTTGCYTQIGEEVSPTLMARDYKDPTTVAPVKESEPHYTVRRLTPTECARLQGFPDWWCSDLGIPNPTDEELEFWKDVWETHRKVVTHASKPKTETQIRKWLTDPYSDSAVYKLYGNGVALPCVYYIMQGIVWAANKE